MDLNNGFFVNLGTNNSSISGTAKYIPVFLTGSTIGNSKIYQDSNNNIGINTITPTLFTGYTTFAVNGTNGGLYESQVNGTTGFTLWSSSGGSYLVERRNKSLYLGTNNITAITIDSSQNSTFVGNIRIGNFLYGNITSQILVGEDSYAYYYAYGSGSNVKPIYMGNSATSNIIYSSLLFTFSGGNLVVDNSANPVVTGIIINSNVSYYSSLVFNVANSQMGRILAYSGGFIFRTSTSDQLAMTMDNNGTIWYDNTGGILMQTISTRKTLNVQNFPTSSAGLNSGDVYIQGSQLKVV